MIFLPKNFMYLPMSKIYQYLTAKLQNYFMDKTQIDLHISAEHPMYF